MRAAFVLATVLALAGACGTSSPTTSPETSPPVVQQPTPDHSGHSGYVTPSPAPLRTGERFVTLAMPKPYTPSAPNGGTDEYRCFLIDLSLKKPAFLTGSQFLPQNTAIVHHAIFFRIGPDDVPKARVLDQRTSGEGWRCFGDSGVEGGSAWVAHWAPNANEVLLRQGLGYELPAGSHVVMQVHYNLLAAGASRADQSRIRLRLADAALTPLHTLLLRAPVELPCTDREKGPLCDRTKAVADVAHRFGPEIGGAARQLLRLCSNGKRTPGPTQRCDTTIRGSGTVYATAGHMHLLGRSIKIELNPGTPTAQTILDIPAYNFDNQAIQPLPEPVKIAYGDVLRVTCTHDAGLRAQIPQLRTLPPRYVVWGDGTSDEMCLGLLVGTLGR